MEYFTRQQVAAMYQVHENMVSKWIKEGKYPDAIKTSGKGEWRIPQCCVDGHPDEEVSDEVQSAKNAANIAEERAREALANQKVIAYALKFDSAEAYQDKVKETVELQAELEVREITQDHLLADAIVKKEAEMDKERQNYYMEKQAFHDNTENYAPKLKRLTAEIKGLQKSNDELQGLLGDKQEQDATKAENEAYFKEHKEQGIELLTLVARDIKAYYEPLATYITDAVELLDGDAVDYNQGKLIYSGCRSQIIKAMELFIENPKKVKTDDPVEVSNWLGYICDEIATLTLSESYLSDSQKKVKFLR